MDDRAMTMNGERDVAFAPSYIQAPAIPNKYHDDQDESQVHEHILLDKIRKFSENTTAHGVRRIFIARNMCTARLWLFGILFCMAILSLQAHYLVNKFRKYEKITSIELRFDNVQYPAVTFCNLNPYKKSLVRLVPSVRDTMDVYENAKSNRKTEGSNHKKEGWRRKSSRLSELRVMELFRDEIMEEDNKRTIGRTNKTPNKTRTKRQVEERRYEAIEAHCKCIGTMDMECIRFESKPASDYARCICTYDRDMNVAWPCFNSSIWFNGECENCYDEGNCDPVPYEGFVGEGHPCVCRSRHSDLKPYCISSARDEIRKLWTFKPNQETQEFTWESIAPIGSSHTYAVDDINNSSSTSTFTSITTDYTDESTLIDQMLEGFQTTPSTISKNNQSARVTAPETVKAMGFTGITDGVAMLTRAKENLIFAMSALSEVQRIALSHTKNDFIEMCSFDGKQCDIEVDFKLHIDPEFGNCYTFNWDKDNNYTSSKAGPMYGIRILVFVNSTDYMATSESSGVRIAVHPPTDYPFPDTFGYSAPVGFASSFGLKKSVVKRLSAPYGDCETRKNMNSTWYIYKDYDYNVEGCHRSCFQNWLILKCGCGDPRFPVPRGRKHCAAFNATARGCLEQAILQVGDFHHVADELEDCVCKQPCEHETFGITFSTSKWPSGATDLGDCEGMNEKECEQYYRLNAAMVDVYYEQLNYELLRESEAYGLVNLLADVGGHLGLWMGFSVITIIEWLVLMFDLLTLCCKRRKERKEFKRQATIRAQSQRSNSNKVNSADFPPKHTFKT